MVAIAKHPIVGALLTFAGFFISAYGIVFLFLFWVERNSECNRVPGDPCDGLGLMAVGLLTFTFPIALIGGIIAAIIAGVVLKEKRDKSRELP